MKRFLRFYLQMAINLASLFLSPQLARAEVIPKLAGYEQVTILKVEPDGIRIMHKDGIAKVPYKLLPKEMQEKLKFDPDAAKDFGEKVRSAQQEREMAEETLEILKKNNASVIGTIFQVVRGGILLENVICGSSKMVQAKKEITTGTKFGTDPNIMHPERQPVYEKQLITQWVKPEKFEKGPIFIACNTTGLVDGESFSRIIFPTGVHNYENLLGANRSIKKFTAHPNDILVNAGLKALDAEDFAEIQVLYPKFPNIPSSISSDTFSGNAERQGKAVAHSGTGTAIADGTLIATCAHVVDGAKKVSVRTGDGKIIEARILSSDTFHDVAILELIGEKIPAVPLCSSMPEQGQEVFTLGFPNPDVQGIESKLTDGKIASLSGINDDKNQMQISVPLQPGNSGGGLFNRNGQLIGIVTSKLSPSAVRGASGLTPENVNYAVKNLPLINLTPKEKDLKLAPKSSPAPSLEDAVKAIKTAVVLVIAK